MQYIVNRFATLAFQQRDLFFEYIFLNTLAL